MNVLHVSYKDPNAPALFARSLRETGFAVLTDHPVSSETILQTFAEWERFFADDSKASHTYTPARQAGYFPFRTEKAKGFTVTDLKEFYHYYPDRITLPEIASKHTPALFAELTRLGAELLGWIEDHTPAEIRGGLCMPLRKMIENSDETLLRPIHYPPLKGTADEDGAIRAAEHEDINLITLLPSATAPGLQVKDTAGRWHEVACDSGSLVINAGDMLQMATKGYYVSTTHRVVNPAGEAARASRYSMPLFLHPAPAVRLSEEHTARSYLRERLKQIGLL